MGTWNDALGTRKPLARRGVAFFSHVCAHTITSILPLRGMCSERFGRVASYCAFQNPP